MEWKLVFITVQKPFFVRTDKIINESMYLLDIPIVYIILSKSIRIRATFIIFVKSLTRVRNLIKYVFCPEIEVRPLCVLHSVDYEF